MIQCGKICNINNNIKNNNNNILMKEILKFEGELVKRDKEKIQNNLIFKNLLSSSFTCLFEAFVNILL